VKIVVVVALLLIILSPRESFYGEPEHTALLDSRAHEVLAAWPYGGRTYLPTRISSERTLAASVELPDTTPDPIPVRWADGSAVKVSVMSAAAAMKCPIGTCTGPEGQVIGARLEAVPTRTAHGWAAVPAWIFTLADTEVVRIAVAPPVYPTHPSGPYATVRRGSMLGTTLTVEYLGAPAGTGPCSAEYATHVVEGVSAVVVIVEPLPRNMREVPVACAPLSASGPFRQSSVQLSRPLGERVLLDLSGLPVELQS
jgi:hypothetical protein